MTESASARIAIKGGEWDGWSNWPAEPFEMAAGPFFYRPGDEPICCWIN